MHRLFVALRPPAAIRAQLIALMTGIGGARWQDDEQLHLTLRFIGEVDARRADDVAAALASLRAPAMTLAIAGVGQFEHRGRADTLWAGVGPHDALAHLHRKIDRALVQAGLPPERRAYRPHITLARLGAGAFTAPFLARHAGLTSAPFTIDAFALFESHLGRDGARYEAVARYPLGDALPA